MGAAASYTQDDIDDYFERLRQVDKERPPEKRESKAKHDQRVAAVKFYTNSSLGLTINFKEFKNKNAR